MVYEPREDSFLLQEQVRKCAFGSVIDMGTGSGIQALAAQEVDGVSSVLAVDIDPAAVQAARDAGLAVAQSDMFEHINGVYDTIISNTPYLPSEPLAPDVALDGGPKGFEWTHRFLTQATKHLSRCGQIIFLISSLTNTAVVEKHMLELGLSWSVLCSRDLFAETLFVYKAVWALPQRPNAIYVASGKRSRVYRDGQSALKVADPRRLAQEEFMLKKANAIGIGPRYFQTTDTYIEMEFIEGERIEDYLLEAKLQDVKRVLLEVLRQSKALDAAGIYKPEMVRPYKHIIVAGQRVVFIDFERAKVSQNASTLTQAKEYLARLSRRHEKLSHVIEEVVHEFF